LLQSLPADDAHWKRGADDATRFVDFDDHLRIFTSFAGQHA
jgi:hypothetical protein